MLDDRMTVIHRIVRKPTATADARARIDSIDAGIHRLLLTRRSVSKAIQKAKQQASLPVFDTEREAEIGRRYEHAAGGSAPVARAILDWCRHED